MSNNDSVRFFIPSEYDDRMDPKRMECGDISDSFNTGFYRYYGFYFGNGKQVSVVKYHIEYNNPICELERLDTEFSHRGKGYGTILLNDSIRDLMTRNAFLERINVCSLPQAIEFYKRNGFEPYFGDNHLTKKIKNHSF